MKQSVPKQNNQFQIETTLPEITSEIITKNTLENHISSSSNIKNLLNIVAELTLENEEEEYLNQMSYLFYKSVVKRLNEKKIFTKKEPLLDVLKTLQVKNIRIGTLRQIDQAINEFLTEVHKRAQTSEPVISPPKFFVGRLEMVINRENTIEIAKTFIRQNKESYQGKVLFYNWLEQ
ncbi:hypothetical protein BT246_69400 (plasmid) [Bacillus thuringiensis]|uniref:Uncharacterized protein n=1 Tax=Bacillus thuringiensis TaxID=1428 RepID=A0A9W3X466_BACTU|nr:hypothetical protein [Bacillus thuringiensis]ANS52231.1 hypothetical protein BT246_69400 [Bacillus thuringiensis]